MDTVFEIRDKDLMGRIGVLYTRSGRIETPAFFPVVHPVPERQDLSPKEIYGIGFRTLITNAYLVKKVYGERAVETGLKKILGFDGVLMTDSGAFQLMQYGDIDVGNREIVEYQERLDQDIAVILDIPTKSTASRQEALSSVEETLRRAWEVVDIVSVSEKIWVLPIQGGAYPDLVELSVRRAVEVPGYRMYGIGSPVTFLEEYEYERIFENIVVVKRHLPPDRPVHLFGAGHPMLVPFIVALGIDTFDAASYVLYARENRYMTEYGTERLEDLEYFPCTCPVCTRYSPRELMEMPERERTRLLAIHNLYVMLKEINRVKTAIREGRLWELLTERSHTHPRLRDLMRIITRERGLLERHSPFSKGRRGLFVTEYESVYRPVIQRAGARAREVIERKISLKRCSRLVLLPGDHRSKPFSSSSFSKRVYEERGLGGEGVCVVYYVPVLGLVSRGLEETYPYSQFEISGMVLEDERALERLAQEILGLVDYARRVSGDTLVEVYVTREIPWTMRLYEILRPRLPGERVEVYVL